MIGRVVTPIRTSRKSSADRAQHEGVTVRMLGHSNARARLIHLRVRIPRWAKHWNGSRVGWPSRNAGIGRAMSGSALGSLQ
jgi:hypothetical protein